MRSGRKIVGNKGGTQRGRAVSVGVKRSKSVNDGRMRNEVGKSRRGSFERLRQDNKLKYRARNEKSVYEYAEGEEWNYKVEEAWAKECLEWTRNCQYVKAGSLQAVIEKKIPDLDLRLRMIARMAKGLIEREEEEGDGEFLARWCEEMTKNC